MKKHINARHKDGVYHPELFEENSKKNWVVLSAKNTRKSLTANEGDDRSQTPPPKKPKRTATVTRKQADNLEAAVAAASIVSNNTNDTSGTSNTDVIDFSHIQEIEPYSVPPIMQSNYNFNYSFQHQQQQQHNHNTRHQSLNNLNHVLPQQNLNAFSNFGHGLCKCCGKYMADLTSHYMQTHNIPLEMLSAFLN